MKNTTFGLEVEFTGINRAAAALAVAKVLSSRAVHVGGTYDSYQVADANGRNWKIVSDSSIRATDKAGRAATPDFRCELVSPVCTYAGDIELVQEIIRAIRKAGGVVNDTCGIHIHLDGRIQTVQSLKNWAAIVASKNDLLYRALQVPAPRIPYCQKIDAGLAIHFAPAKTLGQLEAAWYAIYGGAHGRFQHYHSSRYHFLNLHSFFNGEHHTVELRGFNSTLHAGEVRAYIVLALALNQQAITQKTARVAKPQVDNEKFAMRTYLNRLGLVGEEFATVREVLTRNLTGCAAWRYGKPNAAAV